MPQMCLHISLWGISMSLEKAMKSEKAADPCSSGTTFAVRRASTQHCVGRKRMMI
jgi:hypothetical protein